MNLPADLIKHIFSFLKGDSADIIASLLCKRAIVLHPLDPSQAERICQIAAGLGQSDIVAWARKQGAYCGIDAAIAAAAGGHLSLLRELRAKQVPWDYRICQEAAFHGHIRLLGWAIGHGTQCDHRQLSRECMLRGQFAAAELLNATGQFKGRQTKVQRWAQMALAAAVGINSDEPQRACDMAAIGGQLEVLKQLRQNNVPWDAVTFEKAIRGQHERVINWLKDAKCPVYAGCCYTAAAAGNKAMLIWLKGNGCSFDPETLNAAARAGHCYLVRWLYRNGCPINVLIFFDLARLEIFLP